MKPVNRQAWRVIQSGLKFKKAKRKQAHSSSDYTFCKVCGCSLRIARLDKHMRRVHNKLGAPSVIPVRKSFSVQEVAHVVVSAKTFLQQQNIINKTSKYKHHDFHK